jgi:hypothetical protein
MAGSIVRGAAGASQPILVTMCGGWILPLDFSDIAVGFRIDDDHGSRV